MKSIGFGAYGEKEFHGLGFGEFVNLSPEMQALLPGASLESGYSISPDEGGYFGIKGPDLLSPAFTSGVTDFKHPITQKLLFKAKASKTRPSILSIDSEFNIMGWALVAIIFSLLLR